MLFKTLTCIHNDWAVLIYNAGQYHISRKHVRLITCKSMSKSTNEILSAHATQKMLSFCQWEMISKQNEGFGNKRMAESLLNSLCCLQQTVQWTIRIDVIFFNINIYAQKENTHLSFSLAAVDFKLQILFLMTRLSKMLLIKQLIPYNVYRK